MDKEKQNSRNKNHFMKFKSYKYSGYIPTNFTNCRQTCQKSCVSITLLRNKTNVGWVEFETLA